MADHHDDPLAGIDDVDWAAVEHAYGPATDIPELLRELAAGGSDDIHIDDTYSELYGNIFHQGTRYPATAVAIPFLCRLVGDPRTPGKTDLLVYLVSLAIGLAADATDTPVGQDVADWLNKHVRPVEQDADGTAVRLREKQAAWVAAGKTKKDRQTRERQLSLSYYSPERIIRETTINYRAYCAVQDGLASVVACLADPSARVRAYAAAALAWFPAALATTGPALRHTAATDDDEGVRATALFSLAVAEFIRRATTTTTTTTEDALPEADPAVVQALQDAFAEPQAGELVRWAASLGLLKLGRASPEQRALVLRTQDHADELAAYVSSKLADRFTFPFAGGLQSDAIAKLVENETKVAEEGEESTSPPTSIL